MDFDLTVTEINGSIEEYMETDDFKAFTSQAAKYYKSVYTMCHNIAKNETQFKIFDDWWNGKSLWRWVEKSKTHIRAAEYRRCSEEDWRGAQDLILTAVSAGCG